MRATALDHVALWVSERSLLASTVIEVTDVHEIERTDAFTLLGGDARLGKLTLFDAEPPRERGLLERIVMRVPDVGACTARLDALGIAYEKQENGSVCFDAPGDVPFGLVERDGTVDLDSVELRVADPTATAATLLELGFDEGVNGPSLGDRHVSLTRGDVRPATRPLLNHIALLVDSAEDTQQEAIARLLEVEKVVDAPNTIAVFLRGPDDVLLEYVEHKPSFSLV